MENSEILLKRAIAAIHENAILDEEWAVVGSSNRRKDLLRQLGKLGNKFVTFKEKFLQSKEELKDRAYSKLYKDAITDKIFSMDGKEIDICDKIIAEVNVIGTEVF